MDKNDGTESPEAANPASDCPLEQFHVVNRIMPDDQEVCSISSDTSAQDALQLMQEKGYSQLPVVEGGSVVGLFSYKSFALEVAGNKDNLKGILDLPVAEFVMHEAPRYAQLTDNFSDLISTLNEENAVLVSAVDRLTAILTPMDVLRYLDSVASGFILIEEIEITLRALIQKAIPDIETFSICVKNALSSKYKNSKLPEGLEEMTFNDYVVLLNHGDNWDLFVSVFKGTRERWNGKLKPIGEFRNDVFHFRRELSMQDHEKLVACRRSLLICWRRVFGSKGGE